MLTQMSGLYLNVPVLIVCGSRVSALGYLSPKGVIYYDVNRFFVENMWQAESVKNACFDNTYSHKLKPN